MEVLTIFECRRELEGGGKKSWRKEKSISTHQRQLKGSRHRDAVFNASASHRDREASRGREITTGKVSGCIKGGEDFCGSFASVAPQVCGLQCVRAERENPNERNPHAMGGGKGAAETASCWGNSARLLWAITSR